MPFPGRLARVAPGDARKAHDTALAQHRRLAPFGPRTKRRLLRGGIGGAAVFGLAGWLLVDGSAAGLLYFVLLGGVGGAVVASLALGPALAGLLFGTITLGRMWLGSSGLGFIPLVVLACLGAAFAIGEEGWRSDGD